MMEYDLKKPLEGVMFYQFLTSLKADILRRADELEHMTVEQAQVLASLPAETWKADQSDGQTGNTGGNTVGTMAWNNDVDFSSEEVGDESDESDTEDKVGSWLEGLGGGEEDLEVEAAPETLPMEDQTS